MILADPWCMYSITNLEKNLNMFMVIGEEFNWTKTGHMFPKTFVFENCYSNKKGSTLKFLFQS